MPACHCDNQYSSKPPPGFTDDNLTLKRIQLIDLLKKLLDKCQYEPQFIEEQSKQTDLLISIVQLTLLSTPISSDNKQDFINNIISIAQDLLKDENQINNISPVDSTCLLNENQDITLNVLPSNDIDGEFSLADLANEFLQNEPTPPSSLNDKSEEIDLTLDDLSKNYLSSPSSSSTSSRNILSNLIFPSPESIIIKNPLESILFSNRLSSHDAADDADCIWKEESSSFGQIFCTKINHIQTLPIKRTSKCLLDHTLYERLTRLIDLLPKQCIRNSVQQVSFRHNTQQQQQYRPPRPNNGNKHSSYRPSFQNNSSQMQAMPHFPHSQNSRQYTNSNYPNQQGYSNGYFVDRRQQQQQNRHPPPSSFVQHSGDYQQHQSKGPPKNNFYVGGHQQQKKKSQTNNQQGSNQFQNQRSNKKNSNGGNNKTTNEKPDMPLGSGPNLNSK